MSAHTPGPWEVGASGTDIYYPITPDSWVYVASASSRGASDNDEANAKLIAAAPEMAEALRVLLTAEFGPQWRTHHQVKDAGMWRNAVTALTKAGL